MIRGRDQFPSHARLRRPAQRHGHRERGQLPARYYHHQDGQEEERVDSAPDHKFRGFISGVERCGRNQARGQGDVPNRRPDHGLGRADDRCGWHVERAGGLHHLQVREKRRASVNRGSLFRTALGVPERPPPSLTVSSLR
jgi:hypothetical protein